jgi:hypothetical protein
MAEQTRNPTGDEAVSGTWTGSAGTRYTVVDDYPDTGGTDELTHGTATAGNLTFTFSAFTLPTIATAITVLVDYYDYKTASQTCNIAARLKVNGTYYASSTHNPANGSANRTQRTDTFATNPNTGAAWTVADVNGSGSNPLQAFGWVSSDANPSIVLSSIRIRVTYTADYVLNAEPGSFSNSGQAGSTLAGRLIVGAAGAYTLDGLASTLAAGRLVMGSPGAYTIAGSGDTAPTFIGAETGATPGGGASSIVIDVPAGTEDGDLLRTTCCVFDFVPTITAPSGWDLVREDTGGGLRMATYERVADSEPADYTWTRSGSGGLVGITAATRGQSPSPNDASVHAETFDEFEVDSPGVTTTVPHCTLLGLYVTTTGTGTSFTAPSGMQKVAEVENAGAGSPITLALMVEEDVATGATGARDAACATDEDGASQLFAIRPPSTALLRGLMLQATAGAFTLTGADAELTYDGATHYTLVADAGALVLTGAAAALVAARALAAMAGSYSVSGASAGVLAGRVVQGDAGAYTTAGSDAGLTRGRFLASDAGSYATSGQVASLLRAAVLASNAGVYAISGADAVLTYSGEGGYTFAADAGAYTITGASAGVLRGYPLTATAGSYTATGQSAGLLAARTITGAPGTLTLTGAAATVTATRHLVATAGAFTTAGADATLVYARAVVASPGAYALTGFDATLEYVPIAQFSLDGQPGAYTVTGYPATLLVRGQNRFTPPAEPTPGTGRTYRFRGQQ